jgi:hypothetical protein
MLTRVDPPIWLETPRGGGFAHFVERLGLELSLYWTVFLENGAIFTFPNEQVRASKNLTMERPAPARPGSPLDRPRFDHPCPVVEGGIHSWMYTGQGYQICVCGAHKPLA